MLFIRKVSSMKEEDYKIAYENVMVANKMLEDEREMLTKENFEWYKRYKKLVDRIGKAINYIEEYCIDDEFYVNLTKKEKCIIEVLHILKDIPNNSRESISLSSKEESEIPEKLKLYAPYPECEDNRFDVVEAKINEIIEYLEKVINNEQN